MEYIDLDKQNAKLIEELKECQREIKIALCHKLINENYIENPQQFEEFCLNINNVDKGNNKRNAQCILFSILLLAFWYYFLTYYI